MAAEAGLVIAQYNLAMYYSQAQTSPSNTALEVKWMTLAAQQGFAPAQLQLGALYTFCEGLTSDYTKAFEWNYKAAEQGYSDSQVNISDAYQHGTGVKRDLVLAYKWLRVAIDQGEASWDSSWGSIKSRISDPASMMEQMKEFVGEMTADQIAKGNKCAASFVPKRTSAI
ncbi:MAG TPA: tetratricopeptide repeat protein, partial [Verrucomicrobiae bacterium]|nr:tetratricopeptide repeat protein [Verrucomicrobiae bacterium]